MRYYVTGANGFIGKHMVKYLEGKGHEVVKVGREVNVELYLVDDTEPFEFIHLAAYGNHYNQTHHRSIIHANIGAVHNIAIALHESKNCQKFYNISTSSIQLPKDTLYSVSKRFGELMVESYNDERFVNIRPYSVYGPGEADHRFIPTVIRALKTGEEMPLDIKARHDWIYVFDFIKAMFDGYTHIGTGLSLMNITVVEMLEEISGKKLRYKKAELRNYDTDEWVCPEGVPHGNIFERLKQTYESFL